MEYLKIKVSLDGYAKRLSRELLVQKGMPLLELGAVLVNAFGATNEHYFLFSTKEAEYVARSWAIESEYMNHPQYPLVEHNIDELGNKFTFLYDTGDNYEFNVTVAKDIVNYEIPEDDIEMYYNYPNHAPSAIALKATGQGIWEDNKYVLEMYLDGELAGDAEEDIDEGISLPWNFNCEKFSDFDNPVDIESIDAFIEDSWIDASELYDQYNDPTDDYPIDENDGPNMNLQYAIFQAVKDQCNELEYVNAAFEYLKDKYDEERALNEITEILLAEIYEVESKSRPFDEEKYKRNILKLMEE